jgi:hypothetical protein
MPFIIRSLPASVSENENNYECANSAERDGAEIIIIMAVIIINNNAASNLLNCFSPPPQFRRNKLFA